MKPILFPFQVSIHSLKEHKNINLPSQQNSFPQLSALVSYCTELIFYESVYYHGYEANLLE